MTKYKIWGQDFEEGALKQMDNACEIPIAVKGALMPDAHQGYGLPIGGVLGCRNAIIPYAVGVDIACRMKLTVLDLSIKVLETKQHKLKSAIDRETRFGMGCCFEGRDRRDHAIMEEDWGVTQDLGELKNKAWKQLGTSGGGNHFVEFGTIELKDDSMGLNPGTYVALLSHSGSRGVGHSTAVKYSRIAQNLHPELEKPFNHLAWLDMDSSEGQEYWHIMNMMGRYASANHEMIHKTIAKNLGVDVLLDVENHHNFAWKETYDGEELIVHRKGATPAGKGVMGIIPGSMATSGFLVRGKGNEESLNSCSHGAGRRMSRTEAKKTFTWDDAKKLLKDNQVTLISSGLDEIPQAYKDIHKVMSYQTDLVEVVGEFKPRLVKMAEDRTFRKFKRHDG